MTGSRVKWLVVPLAALAASLLLCACSSREQVGNGVIVRNEVFTLTGDSLVEDTVVACVAPSGDRIESNMTVARLDTLYGHAAGVDSEVRFEGGRPWHKRTRRPLLMPEYESSQPLVDALYCMSAERIADAVNSSGRFDDTGNLSRLYCSIYLSLAALKPHQSMATLRAMVDKDSIIMQRDGQWPVVSDHVGWAVAAWEVYKVTGDRQWLSYCYHVIDKTLGINRKVLLDYRTGLVHGAGYTSSRPMGARRLSWMVYNDLFACMAVGNNILTAQAYSILSDMADELDITNDYGKQATRIKDAINQHLWNEEKGFYSSFLYGLAIPRQSPVTDNTSQAMCVLWGIADDNRAESLIAQTPVTVCGVNVNYPVTNSIEPFFTNSSWSTTQALWNLASAAVGNENALRHGLGALYRAQALYQSRGIHMRGVKTDELGCGASDAAMVLRVLMGMEFKAEGIEFSPFVPIGMSGTKTLKGFNYRRAVLDITVKGTGNEVASITNDGTELEDAYLPCDIEGHHEIVITLNGGQSTGRVTIHHGEVIMPLTPTVVWNADSGRIVDFDPHLHYRLVCADRVVTTEDSVFALPHSAGVNEYSVEVMGKYTTGYMSRPYLSLGLTPQVAFLPEGDGDLSSVKVVVAHGGDYIIDVGYHPTGTLDVREVIANDVLMGTVVMSRQSELLSDGLYYSNMIVVGLLKGENVITLRQVRLPKAFTSCHAVHLRVTPFD